MPTATMDLISRRHDGEYQQEAGTHPGPLKIHHTNFLRKAQRFQPNSVHSPYLMRKVYSDLGPPNGYTPSPSQDLNSLSDMDRLRSESYINPAPSLNMNNERKSDFEIVLRNSDAPRLAPRGPPPMVQLKSESSILSPPAALEHNFLTVRERPYHPTSRMPNPEPALELCAIGDGPSPRPGPGPSNTVPALKKKEAGLGDGLRGARLSLDAEWQKIKKRRAATWSLRSKIHEMRRALREKQRERSTADDRYFQYARMRGLGITLENQDISKPQKSLTELLEDCQKARDECGPLEDDCNLLEDQLGRDEFELTKLEENFYRQEKDPQTLREVYSDITSDSHDSSTYGEFEVGRESHPLVSKFLSQLGDVDILKERLDYNIEEKFSLEYEKKARLRVGRDLAPDDQEWLDNYNDLERNLLKEINEAKSEAERLKQLCLEQGLVDEDGNPTDFEKQERQTFIEEAPEVDAGAERSQFVKFPILLPRPGSKEVQFINSGPKAEGISHGAGDHINQWLLHQLRSSPLDVNLLARTFEGTYGHIKGEEWQFDVLAFWFKDGARKRATDYRVYSSATATQPQGWPQDSARLHLDTNEGYAFGIAIRSSLLQSSLESKSDESLEKRGLRAPSTANP